MTIKVHSGQTGNPVLVIATGRRPWFFGRRRWSAGFHALCELVDAVRRHPELYAGSIISGDGIFLFINVPTAATAAEVGVGRQVPNQTAF